MTGTSTATRRYQFAPRWALNPGVSVKVFVHTLERLREDFRRRVKTHGSLPSEDAALILLVSLVASGQITLRRIDGWGKIAEVLSQHTAA